MQIGLEAQKRNIPAHSGLCITGTNEFTPAVSLWKILKNGVNIKDMPYSN